MQNFSSPDLKLREEFEVMDGRTDDMLLTYTFAHMAKTYHSKNSKFTPS